MKSDSYCVNAKGGADGYFDQVTDCAEACAKLNVNVFIYHARGNCYCQMQTVNEGPCICGKWDNYDLYQFNRPNTQITYECSK